MFLRKVVPATETEYLHNQRPGRLSQNVSFLAFPTESVLQFDSNDDAGFTFLP